MADESEFGVALLGTSITRPGPAETYLLLLWQYFIIPVLGVSNRLVASDIVANNFSNVIFAKGFLNETMPPLAEKIMSLSIMSLIIGGYVIMDDWFGFPSKTACEDFFAVHGIKPEIIPIDDISAYWKKTEDVQYWRYERLVLLHQL
eukprot:scaffold16088_cov122-Skeletonema_dohrnii-CCMP3373.AAC.3